MLLTIDLTPEQVKKLAGAIRETTSDEMIKAIKPKTDEELLTLSVQQPDVSKAILDALVIRFPRRVDQLHTR